MSDTVQSGKLGWCITGHHKKCPHGLSLGGGYQYTCQCPCHVKEVRDGDSQGA